MSQFKNDRLLKTIRGEPVEATPVWIMRQAGRYLPEYKRVREQAGSFMNLCKTPELACEVTLQPIKRYSLDAAILFSDILTIPDAMGLGLKFTEGKGPSFDRPIQNAADVQGLTVPDLEKLSYVYETIRLVRKEIGQALPLIGFCGSPWTLAAYMIEGRANPGFNLALKMREVEPYILHNLLDILAQSIAAHLEAQIEAGVQVVMLFDTWGGLLKPNDYSEFSLNYCKQVINALARKHYNNKIPVILFAKGVSGHLTEIASSGCDVVGVDWEISLKAARSQVGNKVVLQGNLNPACLLSDAEKIRRAVFNVLDSFGQGGGHIFNLGHGITPEVPPEHVAVLVDAVHELSRPFHNGSMQKN